ncbi:Transcription initiation factor TFIID subunit 8, putative isoform 2 [Hibiscus syriacus]|uniref:Transcription initiation factor TFIID subunit 8, putative isoform 2 n=1 Tax=Hibiscus syriacus TaxID=106335 RepID=A0A6A3AD91_HIBSY|nr:Transcription initiation factor TFIID subunit 8, putative isoform 2 [Hibiscus syriacus]
MSKAQIHLQLRCRALLFDKATIALFLGCHPTNAANSSSSVAVSMLNPNYLQLHGDVVYFTLEGSSQDGGAASNTAPSKSKLSFSAGSRYGESEFDSLSQRHRNEELPETWYNKFIEKYKLTRPYKLSFGDRESEERTLEEMTKYLRTLEKHKRRQAAFQDDQYTGYGNTDLDGNNSADDDTPFFPETKFTMNCVPDSPLPPTSRVLDKKAIVSYGVLDTLPQVSNRSSVMIERLGLMPEYLNMEQGANINSRKTPKKHLSQEQASQNSRKVIAWLLTGVGFEDATEAPVEVFSQFLSCHISKLGRNLKALTDNYRKQCSAIELIGMFLQTSGYRYTKNLVQQTQQQMRAIQSQLQPHHQNALRMAQQVSSDDTTNASAVAANASFSKVKTYHFSRSSSWKECLGATHPPPVLQMQFRQQQLPAMSSMHSQSNNQFRQLTSPQIPQAPNTSIVRAPPVKVEGFSELMGGDTTLKHKSEENKLTLPTATM